MITQKRWSGRCSAGFTLIELLVTILIAAIFFGAMIPFLVYAQSQTANENMRNIALQVARNEIEQIHELDYASVDTVANGGVLGGSQFPTQWPETTGSSSKVFYIGYTVTPVAATSASAAYKLVSVAVSWAGGPQPNFTDYTQTPPTPSTSDPIVLTTQVSQQYDGPQVVNLVVPSATAGTSDPNNPVYTIVAGGLIEVDAYVATQDLSQLTGTPAGDVVFTVTNINGAAVASGVAPTQLSGGHPGEYQWMWDSSTASTGYYTFSAYAVSGANAVGNTWSVTYNVQAAHLPAPQSLRATAGNNSVNLNWGTVSGAGTYQVWRGTSSGAESLLASNVLTTEYLDNSATNGTTYYYKVCAVDSSGNPGALSSEAISTPSTTPDTIPPTAPRGLTLVQATASGIAFTWAASTDSGSGLAEYQVWRSASGSAGTYVQVGVVLPTTAPQFTDFNLTPGTTYYYEVCAVDNNNNVSGFGSEAFTTLTTVPTGSLKVQNKSTGNTPISVSVYNMTTQVWYGTSGTAGAVYSAPFWALITNQGGANVTWTSLPAGMAFGLYMVTANNGTSSEQQQISVSVGQTATVSFKF